MLNNSQNIINEFITQANNLANIDLQSLYDTLQHHNIFLPTQDSLNLNYETLSNYINLSNQENIETLKNCSSEISYKIKTLKSIYSFSNEYLNNTNQKIHEYNITIINLTNKINTLKNLQLKNFNDYSLTSNNDSFEKFKNLTTLIANSNEKLSELNSQLSQLKLSIISQ